MKARRKDLILLAVGLLVFAGGLALFLTGTSRADEAVDDVAAATTARDDQKAVNQTIRGVDREIAERLHETRATRRQVSRGVDTLLAASGAEVQLNRNLFANYDVGLQAIRADDGDGYNTTVDVGNALLRTGDARVRAVDDASIALNDLLGELLAAYRSATVPAEVAS